MAGTATTTRPGTVRRPTDTSTHPWAGLSDQDFLELLANAPSRGAGGKPLRSHYARNLLDVVDWLRRRSRVDGFTFDTTWVQAIRGRGADVEGDRDRIFAHGHSSLDRYFEALAEVGAVEVRPRYRPDGGYGGLTVRLCKPEPGIEPGAYALQGRRSTSAATPKVTCELRWRSEAQKTRERRRVRPRRRRKGEEARFDVRWGAGRRTRAEQAEKLVSPFGVRGDRPVGASPSNDKPETDAREGGLSPPAWLAAVGASWPPAPLTEDGSDAIERTCPASHRAALRALRTAAASGGGLDAVRQAALAGAPVVPVMLAAWSIALPGVDPRASASTLAQAERSAAQLDRLIGRPTAAEWIVHRIGLVDDDRRWGADPRTLRFYVLQLKQVAREKRRHATRRPSPRPWRPRGRA